MARDRAVSPVIGVILMVAITVVLASLIAVTVFNYDVSEQPPGASVEVDTTDGTTVTLHQLQRADGVALVHENGTVYGYATTIGERIKGPDGFSGTVQAYRGSVSDGGSIDAADTSSVVEVV